MNSDRHHLKTHFNFVNRDAKNLESVNSYLTAKLNAYQLKEEQIVDEINDISNLVLKMREKIDHMTNKYTKEISDAENKKVNMIHEIKRLQDFCRVASDWEDQ